MQRKDREESQRKYENTEIHFFIKQLDNLPLAFDEPTFPSLSV